MDIPGVELEKADKSMGKMAESVGSVKLTPNQLQHTQHTDTHQLQVCCVCVCVYGWVCLCVGRCGQ